MEKIYLDYAAATPASEEVIKEMRPFLEEEYGNAGATHQFGQHARAGIDKAREIIANEINTDFSEIIFTGSATEANNLIIRGAVNGASIDKPHIIISAIEHESILETCKSLGDKIDLTIIPVSHEGLVDIGDIKREIREETILVSIIYGSNVIGAVEPIKEIGDMIDSIRGENKYPIFHSDVVQAFQFKKIDTESLHIDALTISGQKIYGPKGVGVLFIKEDKKKLIEPIITGGDQEFGMRSGTENTAGIVGFGKAVEMVSKNREENNKNIQDLRDYFLDKIKKEITGVEMNGSIEKRLPNNINIYFPNTDGETILVGLDQKGISISIGSACKSHANIPSYAVTALDLGDDRATHSVRITLGKNTTRDELDKAIEEIVKIVELSKNNQL